MKHKEGFFAGVRDTKIYHHHWLPEGDPKAVLLIVHGLCEHSGRYMNVVNHLVPQGYTAYTLDHIGHGKSEGARAFVERFQDFIDTLKLYFDMLRKDLPNTPIFILGHSMGGLIASRYLLDYQHELAGAIISAPSIKIPDSISPTTIFLSKLLSTLLPKMGMMQLDSATISHDPTVVQSYDDDPLNHRGKVTARLGSELLVEMKIVSERASEITLPVLIQQGGDDTMIDASGAQMLYNQVQSEDKTLKIYPGLYHEIYNEPERDQVLGDVSDWLETH